MIRNVFMKLMIGTGFCEGGNEPSGCINYKEFLLERTITY